MQSQPYEALKTVLNDLITRSNLSIEKKLVNEALLNDLSKLIKRVDREPQRLDIQKYHLLLIGCQKLCVSHDQEERENLSRKEKGFDHFSILGDFRKILHYPSVFQNKNQPTDLTMSSPVSENDILLAQLYLMSKGVLSEKLLDKILAAVGTGNELSAYTSKSARDDILNIAYRGYLEAKSDQQRQGCINIIIAYRQRVCDPQDLIPAKKKEQINLVLKDKSLNLGDLIWYQAHIACAINTREKSYYESLLNSLVILMNPEIRNFFSESTHETLDNLMMLSNQIYRNTKVGDETQNSCQELIRLLGQFSQTLVEIQSVQKTDKNNLPTATHLETLRRNMDGQISVLKQKIATFPKEAKDPFGFFKGENPLAIQAQQLINQGIASIKKIRPPHPRTPPPTMGSGSNRES